MSSKRERTTPQPPAPVRSFLNRRTVLLGAIAVGGFGTAFAVTKFLARGPEGMKWIPGGEFTMGSSDRKLPQTEQPAHKVRVDGFWMDETEVTNAAFRTFVDATGYVTTAEKKPEREEIKKYLLPNTPKYPDDKLVPGSMVFTPPAGPVPLDDPWAWWKYVAGACWKHPEGPDSNIDDRDDHPVVQVSWDDAIAYCQWADKRLPTEAEWELAARGGLEGTRYTWGDNPPADDSKLANYWQGRFPDRNTRQDGWERTAPVKSFPPNEYGLFDMAGNVWEWCSDWYRADAYARRDTTDVIVNPIGPNKSWNPSEPWEWTPQRVTRGGSFLCHVSYCESYRPAARRGTQPDTGMSHLGFRCVMTKAQ
jgi:formylglycine-generating enzyme